jgi:hypothetical protein
METNFVEPMWSRNHPYSTLEKRTSRLGLFDIILYSEIPNGSSSIRARTLSFVFGFVYKSFDEAYRFVWY